MKISVVIALSVAPLALAGCGRDAPLSPMAAYGLNPQLAAPNRFFLIPKVKIAPTVGWAAGETPTPAAGLAVADYANGLDHPRWIYVLPNGDILVAESRSPTRKPGDPAPKRSLIDQIRGKVQARLMRKAGAAGASADRITLLRDVDGDGKPDVRTIFLKGLHSPIGMALVGDQFYVGDTDGVMRFPYVEGATSITAAGVKVTDVPAAGAHWVRNLVASPDGAKLYVGVGSNSNVADGGIEAEKDRAAILEVDTATGKHSVFASGLRNPTGLAWNPTTGALWTAVNERDELGDDLVPDYITSVARGGFYGWPYSYFGQHLDSRVKPQRPDLVATARQPDYAMGAHTASLGLAFYTGQNLPTRYDGGAFVGQHGSWNRKPVAGYKVVFVPFAGGKPTGAMPEDVLTGFLNGKGQARGRPVGVAVDKAGGLLVADDVGDRIWRVTSTSPRPPAAP